MIEFLRKNNYDEEGWMKLHHTWDLPDDFNVYDYRIDGILYEKCTTEFKEAFKKEKFWQKLTNKG